MEKNNVRDLIRTNGQKARQMSNELQQDKICFFCKLNRAIHAEQLEIRLKRNMLILTADGMKEQCVEICYCPICGEQLLRDRLINHDKSAEPSKGQEHDNG